MLVAALVLVLFELSAALLLRNESFLKTYLPIRIISVWDWLRARIRIDIASYRSLLGPLITISGAFLGLYFTALNVLLSSTYKQVTADVRELLTRDKIGNTYTRIVAFTGAYSLIVFGLITVGYRPRLISLIFLVCLGVTEIYCFLSQWFSLFRLFDPSMLASYLTRDLVFWIKAATIKGRWSRDVLFQTRFQRKAEENLATYRNLIFTVRSEEHLRSESLIKLANTLLSLFWFYQTKKFAIPSNSKWFKNIFQFKDWLIASHSEISLATETGTTLYPNEVPDLMWMEKEIGKIIDFALNGFLEKHDLTNALSLFNNFQSITRNVARNYSIDEALLLFRIIKERSQAYLEHVEVPEIGAQGDLEPLRFTLALVDFYGLSLINLLLGLSDATNEVSLEFLECLITKTNWNNEKTLYRTALPRKVLQQLESAQRLLAFERIVEGTNVTPTWYQLQLLTLSYFRFLNISIDSLLLELQEVFLREAELLSKQNKHIIAVHIIERGFEACNKFAHHFHSLEAHCNGLAKSRKLTDVPSVNFTWDEYQKKIQSVHERLVILFSQLLYQVVQWPILDQLPDYFGHADTVLTEECLKAMGSGNEGLFKKLFPTVFNACLAAHDRQIKLDIIDLQSKFVLFADPIVDLFDLSGYSIIFQELDGKNYWQVVQSCWDKYFSRVQDKTSLINLLINLATHHTFMLSPRSIVRTSWKQYLTRILRERGLVTDHLFYGEFSADTANRVITQSKTIRRLARSGSLHNDAQDLFVATYFRKEIDNNEIEVTDRIRHLIRDILETEIEDSGKQ